MKRCLVYGLLVLCLSGCGPVLEKQSEDQAISLTNLFLKDMYYGKYAQAYDNYISENTKKQRNMSFPLFQESYQDLVNENGPIKKIIFDSYQAVPKKNEIQLYYRVTHEIAGEILYHVILEGSSQSGYKVSMMDIGNTISYPPGIQASKKIPERLRKTGMIELQLD